MERRLAAIFAADVVGYARLMGEDEAGTLERLKALHKELVQPRIVGRKGRVVKLMGDGLLAEFPSVVEAVQCAIEIQESINERELDLPEERRIQLRIGVNLGDIIVEGSDIYGDGVNVAARLEGLAEPRGVCISGSVYEEVRSRIDVEFTRMGEQRVKNIAHPVRTWRWMPEASSSGMAAHMSSARQEPSEIPSIAVLPFRNMSGDPEQEYFADGITEDIIIDLTRYPNMRISARNASFAYKNAKMTTQEIASELDTSYVLTGSIRKSGGSVRIVAQLVKGHTDEHIWAERYDRKLDNIFELQSEISRNIADSLTGTISVHKEAKNKEPATTNAEAYQNYLRARSLMREMTRRSVELAMAMFTKAVAHDPNYALAYCGLSDCAGTLASHYDTDRNHSDDATAYALRALEIDPNLAEAHGYYGKALELADDEVGAEREYRRAITLAPKSYHAYLNLGQLFLVNDDAQRALPLMLKAYELTNEDLHSAMMLSNTYRALGNCVELRKVARKTVELSDRRLSLNPEDDRAAYVGAMALLDLGDFTRAKQWLDLAVSVSQEDSRTSYNLACAYGLLGSVEDALAHLEKTLSLGCPARKKEWMRVDSDLNLVRADSRFAELLARHD